ncbi:MAG: 50S ribosomal protein L18 [Puniceicoccaceae bacterium]
MKLEEKKKLLQKRRWRIRRKVKGTSERPRLVVRFTNLHIHVQVIDDTVGNSLAHVTSVAGDFRAKQVRPNIEGATIMGKAIAEAAKAKGISDVVFDRAGRRYHGCVKAFADAAREGGLNF